MRAQNSACGFHRKIPCPGCPCWEGCGGGAQLGTECGWSQTPRGSQAPSSRFSELPPDSTPPRSSFIFPKVKDQRAPDLSTGLGSCRGLESDFPGVYASPCLTLGIYWAFGGLGVRRKSQMFASAPHSTSQVTGRAWRTSGNSKCAVEVEGVGRHHRVPS